MWYAPACRCEWHCHLLWYLKQHVWQTCCFRYHNNKSNHWQTLLTWLGGKLELPLLRIEIEQNFKQNYRNDGKMFFSLPGTCPLRCFSVLDIAKSCCLFRLRIQCLQHFLFFYFEGSCLSYLVQGLFVRQCELCNQFLTVLIQVRNNETLWLASRLLQVANFIKINICFWFPGAVHSTIKLLVFM